MYHGWARWGRAWTRDASSPLDSRNFEEADAKIMFGTLTLIKRNGSEGSTMTMDSRETTIGR